MKAKNITLALGAGGFKGYAHIGVIEQLKDLGYSIKGIAGTSAGGVFGSFYAHGYTLEEIRETIDNLETSKLFSRKKNDSPSLIGLHGLYKILEDFFGEELIEDLTIPFATTAVDIITNQVIILNSGKVIDAVKATSAVPGIFPYIKINQLNLVDGGIFDPVPVKAARYICPKYPVIAVCLTPPKERIRNLPKFQVPSITPIPSTFVDYFYNLRLGKAFDVLLNSLDIMQIVLADVNLENTKPDVILRPDTSDYYYLDDVDVDDLVANGKRSVLENLSFIEKAIEEFQPKEVINPGVLFSDLVKKY